MLGEGKVWRGITAENIRERPFDLYPLYLKSLKLRKFFLVSTSFLLLSKPILSSFVGLWDFIKTISYYPLYNIPSGTLGSKTPLLKTEKRKLCHQLYSRKSVRGTQTHCLMGQSSASDSVSYCLCNFGRVT